MRDEARVVSTTGIILTQEIPGPKLHILKY